MATLAPMRRWFTLLLLVLLPIQFSSAAMAAVGQHGTQGQHRSHGQPPSDATPHCQHHAQPVMAEPDAGQGDTLAVSGASAAMDLDCDHCHGCCAALPAVALPLAASVGAPHPSATREGTWRTHAQSPPDRPQWLRLA